MLSSKISLQKLDSCCEKILPTDTPKYVESNRAQIYENIKQLFENNSMHKSNRKSPMPDLNLANWNDRNIHHLYMRNFKTELSANKLTIPQVLQNSPARKNSKKRHASRLSKMLAAALDTKKLLPRSRLFAP